LKGLNIDIPDNLSQSEFEGISMNWLPHMGFNVSDSSKFGVVVTWFYRSIRFCSPKKFFMAQMASLTTVLKSKSCSSNFSVKVEPEVCLKKETDFCLAFLPLVSSN
jgi:hypothetical protein